MGADAASGRRGAGWHPVQQPVAVDAGGVHCHAAGCLYEQSEAVRPAGGAYAVQRAGGGREPAHAPKAEAGRGRRPDQAVRRALLVRMWGGLVAWLVACGRLSICLLAMMRKLREA